MKPVTGVRLAAAQVLLRLAQGRTTLAAEVETARAGVDDPRDRGLLVELTTGVLRWQSELDALLASAAQRGVSTIDPHALVALRLGAYQMRHLARVPDHAVVNESVDLVRALGSPRAAGFVNAVLRTMIRRGPTLSLPKRPKPGAADANWLPYLSITLSHPAWLVRRWIARYGVECTERWLQFNNEPPEITVRPIRPITVDAWLHDALAAGIAASIAPHVSDAIRLAPGSLGRLPHALREQVVVQDEGSQLVARFAAARPGERVLDVCAAPGGKTVVLAADMAADASGAASAAPSLLVAGDRRPGRVSLLAETVRHAGLRVPVVAHDALRPLPFSAVFDCVLLDAPCSGLGTLRRDPDLKWSRREADLPRLAEDQMTMLSAAADAVRPGGRLVYATCSSEPEENAQVVARFLAADSRFTRAETTPNAPADMTSGDGDLTTEPWRHQLDAFFAATLVRRTAT